MHSGPTAQKMTELVEQYHGLLYRYAYRLCGSAADAEDLTQQAYLNAQRRLHLLREPDRAKSWLCAIVRNLYLKSLRERRAEPVGELKELPVVENLPSLPGDVDAEQLQRSLSELPEAYRTTLVLFYFDEFSYREIAEHLEVPLGTVMSRLARAKTHLKRKLLSAGATPVVART